MRKIYVWISRWHDRCQKTVEILERKYLGRTSLRTVGTNLLSGRCQMGLLSTESSPGDVTDFINRKISAIIKISVASPCRARSSAG